jgi:mersacidin/lichenicidin family type 2 lantibiotic
MKGTIHMKFDIARAWKDETYRQTLSAEELATLPANPVGEMELNDAELDTVAGGFGPGFGFGSGCGCGGTAVVNHETSVALICAINVNSINLINAAVLGAVTNICANITG